MEKQLFDWTEWDVVDTGSFMFYNATLKVPIGDFAVGETFSSAFVDYETGKLEFYAYEGEKTVVVGTFNLTLQVKNEI